MSAGRTLVFGDIHGEIAKLNTLLNRLQPTLDDTLIFLGDYIDRGQDSQAVLNRLMGLDRSHNCIFLMGNHEEMFLRAVQGDSEMMQIWRENGGEKTIKDFGGLLPPIPYANWMAKTLDYYTDDLFFYVHAGVEPGKPPEESDMAKFGRWIRHEFLTSNYDWGKIIVHGHTIDLLGPEILPNRINLDTGAFTPNGRLTCMIDGQLFLQTDKGN